MIITDQQKKSFGHAYNIESDDDGRFPLLLLRYIQKLRSLEPKSVKIYPYQKESVVFLAAPFPFGYIDYFPEDPPDEFEIEPLIIKIEWPQIWNQAETATYCGVTTRQIQNWEKSGLRNFKFKNLKLYLEEDLDAYMNEWGVGERWKSF